MAQTGWQGGSSVSEVIDTNCDPRKPVFRLKRRRPDGSSIDQADARRMAAGMPGWPAAVVMIGHDARFYVFQEKA